MKHYTIIIPSNDVFSSDYIDGIMAKSIEDAAVKFDDCLDLSEYTQNEIISFISEI